ncbi:MAG: hypothetical protein V7K50_16530 [Nostoc sp.]
MNTKTLTAILHKEEDTYVAECPEVGTVEVKQLKKLLLILKKLQGYT